MMKVEYKMIITKKPNIMASDLKVWTMCWSVLLLCELRFYYFLSVQLLHVGKDWNSEFVLLMVMQTLSNLCGLCKNIGIEASYNLQIIIVTTTTKLIRKTIFVSSSFFLNYALEHIINYSAIFNCLSKQKLFSFLLNFQ